MNGAKETYTDSFGMIGGLYSFLTTLRKLIKEYKPTKVILMWDGEGGGVYRHRIDPAYKANRKSKEWYNKIELTEAEIRREKEKEISTLKQKKRIQAYAEELFLRQIEVNDIEADDLIASYCLKHHKNEEIHIFTNDRDFAQLLDLNITIIFANMEQPVTKFNYLMHFKHHYTNAINMKIITGDTSDNIKGIEGLGEDTLLKYFPEIKVKYLSVREICAKADEINKERVLNKMKPLKKLENLVNGVSRLKTNYKLVNLREPILNEEAEIELEQLEMPLAPEGRGSKNLYKMMIEDEFLKIYGGTFPNYVEPFYSVIMNEKQLLLEYKNKFSRK
jgi:5'-3' exonuclease